MCNTLCGYFSNSLVGLKIVAFSAAFNFLFVCWYHSLFVIALYVCQFKKINEECSLFFFLSN